MRTLNISKMKLEWSDKLKVIKDCFFFLMMKLNQGKKLFKKRVKQFKTF